MPEYPFKTLVPMLALLWACGPVQAVEFGAASTTAVLGAPLDFVVDLNWSPGDEADPRCVAADVAMGGVLVPSRGVSVALRRSVTGTSVRVRTAAVVHDPVVGVVVSVGCPARLTRRFTVLADPPGSGWPAQPTPLQQRQEEAQSPSFVPRAGSRDRNDQESPARAGLPAPARVGATGETAGATGAAPAAARAAVDPRSRLEVAAPVVRAGRSESGLPPRLGGGDRPGGVPQPQWLGHGSALEAFLACACCHSTDRASARGDRAGAPGYVLARRF